MIARPPTPPPAPVPAPPIQPGANVRMGRNPLGVWFQGPSGGGTDFRHPWLVTAGGLGARVAKGLILADIAVEPVIGKVPVGGNEKNPQPVLKLSPAAVNRSGQSWVCVEVTPNAEGKLDEEPGEPQVVVVQRESPIVTTGKTGRVPLALLIYKGATPQVFQIAMFHFRYETAQAAGQPRKHFFL